ncbi:MAG TPA: AAA family ATPase [Mobilitalea sp.]|nr:AAA family ATPase [Mobilitalea sp.]
MKRKQIEKLITWKNSKKRKPVLLSGAKGVGKTYLAYDFAKAFFIDIFYMNFEMEPLCLTLFEPDDASVVAEKLLMHFNCVDNDAVENRILILDEITFCPKAFRHLIALEKSGVFPKIIVIASSPIPKDFLPSFYNLEITPLQFDEFLVATSNEWYIEAITNHFQTNKPIPDIVHKELLTLHEQYMQIGGMPGIVNEYLNFHSTINIPEQHSHQFGAFHDNINKRFRDSDALKMNQILDCMHLQLMKDNRKFQYKLIRKGTTYAMYKDAIQYLKDNAFILPCYKQSTEQLVEANCDSYKSSTLEENTNFKLYHTDVGFLYSKIAEAAGIHSDPKIRKSLLENYVAQSFYSQGYPLMFWESDSMAKIDFILPKDNDLIPVEIHNTDNTRSKSISILKQKYEFNYAVKISSKNFDFSNQIKYVPYYAVFCL